MAALKEPPKDEWMCLSCKYFNPEDRLQWSKPPCNLCSTHTSIKWKPKEG